MPHHLVFVDMKYFFVQRQLFLLTWNTFSFNIGISFTLHIGSMLIFFVAVLETKKLLIHLLLICLMLRIAPEKRCFYYLGLMFVKHIRRVRFLEKMQLSLDDANDAWQDDIFLMYLTIWKGVCLLERVMQSFISKCVS